MKRQLTKISCVIILLSISSVITAKTIQQAHITKPGFFMGLQGGVSFVDYGKNLAPGFTATRANTTGLATRVYGGFDITHYFGAEIGVSYFSRPHFHEINGSNSARVKNNVIFLLAKGLYPFNNRLAAYASLGFGYVARSGIIISNTQVLSDKEIIRPIYALGLTYLIWPRWSVDLTWLQAAKQAKNRLPFSNFIGIGIRYKFTA